jgi:membrane-bound lytic murein transglycosylase D
MTSRTVKLLGFVLAVSTFLLFTGCFSALVKNQDPSDTIITGSESPDSNSVDISKDLRSDQHPVESPEQAPVNPQETQNLIEPAALSQDRSLNDSRTLSSAEVRANDGNTNISIDSVLAEKQIQPMFDEALNLCDLSQEFWQKGELDNALDALDQAYALLLDADISDKPKLIQQKEDLRFLISRRILEIYASRNIVVNGNHNAIPVVINKYVQTEIKNFTTGGERRFFIESYRRSGQFRPRIVAELKKAGLPEELSWLPLIESGFKVRALSRARALGLWQFIPSTGYKFGLSRNTYIDERLDPAKATEAAIAYMKELHNIFGDWTTVLAAYNCGEGRVLRVIRTQNVNYLDNFWDLYERLPYETARYVPRFLATLHIVANLERYGLDKIEVDSPIPFETVEVFKQVHLKNVANAVGTSEKDLRQLNPELRYRILPPENYSLRVPPGSADILLSSLNDIPVTKPPTKSFIYHRVRRGETLSTIARKYRTRVRSIMRANNLRSSHYIVAGRLLKIPKSGYRYKKKPTITRTRPKTTHIVTRGDSLWNIAKRYGTTTRVIQELNHLDKTELSIGQVLRLPGHPDTVAAGGNYKIYLVQAGDSPFTIAQQHNMALNQFMRINNLSHRSRIYPGQQLFIE